MEKYIRYLFFSLIFTGCSHENVLPEDPLPDNNPVSAVIIETGNEIAQTFALTKVAEGGYAVTGLSLKDETNFYPFFASIGDDFQLKYFESSIEGKARDYGSDIVETGGNFFIVSHNLPADLVYEMVFWKIFPKT